MNHVDAMVKHTKYETQSRLLNQPSIGCQFTMLRNSPSDKLMAPICCCSLAAFFTVKFEFPLFIVLLFTAQQHSGTRKSNAITARVAYYVCEFATVKLAFVC